jgi:hypothetical protein
MCEAGTAFLKAIQDDAAAQQAMQRVKEKLAAWKVGLEVFGDVEREVQKSAEVLAAKSELEEAWAEVTATNDQWQQTYGVPFPKDADDWKRLAVRAGLPANYVRKGRWTGDDVLAIIEGYLLRQKDNAGVAAAVATQTGNTDSEDDDAQEQCLHERVLNILSSMATYIERTPRTFLNLDEPAIRNLFLTQLNGHFGGCATGETENGNGKTDILVRVKNRNVFIGECKFWDGRKKFDETIDQLLEYLTYRDRRCAILVFNRQKNTTSVADRMHEAMKDRKEFVEVVEEQSRGPWRYYFRAPGDPERRILITTLLFDIPTESEQ